MITCEQYEETHLDNLNHLLCLINQDLYSLAFMNTEDIITIPYTIFEDNQIIGFIQISVYKNNIKELYLDTIEVLRKGEGKGKHIVQYVIDEARGNSFDRIIVSPENEKAANFFKVKLGFKCIDNEEFILEL